MNRKRAIALIDSIDADAVYSVTDLVLMGFDSEWAASHLRYVAPENVRGESLTDSDGQPVDSLRGVHACDVMRMLAAIILPTGYAVHGLSSDLVGDCEMIGQAIGLYLQYQGGAK